MKILDNHRENIIAILMKIFSLNLTRHRENEKSAKVVIHTQEGFYNPYHHSYIIILCVGLRFFLSYLLLIPPTADGVEEKNFFLCI